MSMIFNVTEAEARIKYSFRNKSLLRQAFTHSSYSNENNVPSNERLEFLGDAVLSFVIAEHLYKKFPHYKEGELTKHRAAIVSAQPLAKTVEDMRLIDMTMLGEGERRSEHKGLNIYADLYESVVAAVYLDGGLAAAKRFIMFSLKNHIRKSSKDTDYKSQLSQYSQRLKKRVVYNTVSQKGPAHSPHYTVQVKLAGEVLASAEADSKKNAQQLAAQKAIGALRGRGVEFEL